MTLYGSPPEGFRSEFDVVSCVLVSREEILLLLRPEGKPQGGKWGLPSGKRNDGESLLRALRREVGEETGLPGRALCYEFLVRHAVVHPENSFEYFLYRAPLPDRPEIRIHPWEHLAYQWVSPWEVHFLPLVDDLGPLIRRHCCAGYL